MAPNGIDLFPHGWQPHPRRGERIPRTFFARPTLWVARHLLGARLVHEEGPVRVAGIVVETEAYIGEVDKGCHARAGPTPRTMVMYGPPGHAYVYFNYGMHWLFNVVTEREGFPAAVLVRAVLPIEGLEHIADRRAPQPPHHWTDGPAKVCQAFNIHGRHHGLDLCASNAPLYIVFDGIFDDVLVLQGPRVGLNRVPEPWRSVPWRFRLHPAYIRKAMETILAMWQGQT